MFTKYGIIPYAMLLIICVERFLHIGSHFSLRKWRCASFSCKIGGSGLIFLQNLKIGGGGLIFLENWWRRQGFDNITGGCSDMVWILGEACSLLFSFLHVAYSYLSSYCCLCRPLWSFQDSSHCCVLCFLQFIYFFCFQTSCLLLLLHTERLVVPYSYPRADFS